MHSSVRSSSPQRADERRGRPLPPRRTVAGKELMIKLSEMIPNLKSRKEPKPKPVPGEMPPGYPGLPGQPPVPIKGPEASQGSSKKKGKKNR